MSMINGDQLEGMPKQNGQPDNTQTAKISGEKTPVDKGPGPETTAGDKEEEGLVIYKFGWFGWKPDWLQRVNRPRWLLVFLCCYSFMQGLIVNGFVNVVISTLEERFDLPSARTGLIASTYDIATATLVVFVTYYGERAHKARWIAFGCVIMAVGSIIFALPHFTTGLHTNISGSLVCVIDSNDQCQGSTSLANYFYVFILSQVLHGIGCTPLYSIGLTLIDESVTVHQSAFYIGIFYAVSAIGPGVGYVVGGVLLSIYTDVGEVDLSSLNGLTPNDPGWVGAWWIGFIIGGIIAFFVAIPLFGFPKEFPTTRQIRSEKVSEVHASSGGEKVSNPGFGEKLSDLPLAVKYLLLNPPFVFLVLAGCSEGLIVGGFAAFGPKVIETQFGKTAGDASLLMGVCAIPGAGLGTFLGGYLMKRWKLKVRGMIKFSCVTTTVTMIAVLGMLIRCPQEHLVGVNVDYNGNITVPETLINECNSNCSCTRTEFNPVCGDNGLEYFDPCFAGCTIESEGAEFFSECACLNISGTKTSSTATSGKCTNDCGYLPLFLIVLVVLMVFNFLAAVPVISSIIRCVPESQRSLAIGIEGIMARLLGTIPGPIVFGAVLDSSCILWQEDCKGVQGSCFLYSGRDISWKFFLLGVALALLTLLFLLLALWSYKRPEDENEEKAKEAREEIKDESKEERESYKPDMGRMISCTSQSAIISNESLPPEYEDTVNDTKFSIDNMIMYNV